MAKYTYMRTPEGTIFQTSHPEYHGECERLTQAAGKIARKEYCRQELRKMIVPGQKIHLVLRNVSASGMSRRISAFIVQGDDLRNIDMLAADAIGWKVSDKGGVILGGCGMDMGFHLVYTLGRALFPDGFATDGYGRNGDTSGHDKDGGYALKHSWA